MSITTRIDRITLIPSSRLHTVLPPPKSVKIELTGRCNYRCAFCALAVREKQPTQDMNLDLFKRITWEMREAGVEEIGLFFIGESFLNPPLLLSALQYLKRELDMPYVFLTSNGSAAEPKIVAELMRSGLDSLKWSCNAADAEQFEAVMKVSAKMFERAQRNIKDAYSIRNLVGAKTHLYASSIQYDGEQQERMQKYLEANVLPYVDEHYWLPLYSMGSFATARERELGYRPTAGNQGRLGALREPLPCWSAFTEGHVTAKGHLSACCFDATDTWTMADLNSVSFMEGWNSLDFQALRAAHLRRDVSGTACEKCVAYQGE